MTLHGLQGVQTLFSGTYAEVLRCRRSSDGASVIVKHLLPKTRSLERVARLRHEYDILLQIAKAGARNTPSAPALVEKDNDFALFTSDIGGISLEEHRREAPLAMLQVLNIGVECCKALMDVHAVGVVHKDIKPRNIVLNATTGQVELIDFGLAARAACDTVLVGDRHGGLEGTLTHMAPEQTGRLQVTPDRRIDFYGLGATLYDLLTGRPPVPPGERGRMIHDLLTAQPPAPRSLAPDIPEAVERIILRLLEKNPAGRYKSAYGLLCDLERCRDAWRAKGAIASFEPAERDRSEVLEWPAETLGRQAEVDAMAKAAAPRPAKGVRICVVQAPYGMGKTALLRGVAQKLRAESGAWFAAASCDASKTQSGLHAITEAVESLIRQMLMGTQQDVELWRRRTRAALGSIGDALAQLVPVLTALIGEQPKLPDLGPRESENRLFTCLQRLFSTIAEHVPLVLCLDDAHYADPATVRLLQTLEEHFPKTGALSYIIAYDAQHLAPDRPVYAWLSRSRQRDLVTPVQLRALSIPQVALVLEGLFGFGGDELMALAQTIHSKTLGKSGAVRMFTERLWRDSVVRFDVRAGRWRWDLVAASRAVVTDDVAAFVKERVLKLPADTRNTLSRAACLGSSFDMAQLEQVIEDPQAMWTQLALAYEAGALTAPDSDGVIHFTHEQVRVQTRAALDPSESRVVHARIARFMREHKSETHGLEWFCSLADHMNAAGSGHADGFTTRELADVNRHAARSAYQSLSYTQCVRYLDRIVAELDASRQHEDIETIQEALALKILAHTGLGDVNAAEAAVDALGRKAETANQKSFAAEKKAAWQWVSGQYIPSLDTTIERVRMLGEKVPKHPTLWHVMVQAFRFKLAMRLHRDSIETIAQKPFMTDEHQKALTVAMRSILLPAALVRPYLLMWTAYRLGEIITRHGVEQSSPAVLSALLMQAVRTGRYDEARRWAACLRTLAERSDRPVSKAYVELFIMQQLEAMAEHPQIIVDRMEAVGRVLADNGDYSSAVWAYMTQQTLLSTISLDAAIRFCEEKSDSPACALNPAARAHLGVLATHARIFQEGDAAFVGVLDDLKKVGQTGFLPVLEWLSEATFSLAARNLSAAYAAAKQLDATPIEKSTSEMLVAWQCTLVCLACTQFFIAEGRGTRLPRRFHLARKRLNQIARLPSFRLKGAAILVDADVAVLQNKFERATFLYEQACSLLQTSGYTTMYAFATDAAGRFFKRRGLDHMARTFIARACAASESLGAFYKSRSLKEEFSLASATFSLEDSAMDGANAASTLDTLGEFVRDMASDRNRTALAKKMKRWVHESVAATRVVVAVGAAGERDSALEGADGFDLPLFLRADKRKTATLTVNDVALATEYAADPYFASHHCSGFCYVPIVHKGRVTGWIYYEGKDANAFLPQTLLMLELLAGQAALAIENAIVYQRLEDEVALRTQDERRAKEQLFEAARDHAELQMAGGFAHEIRNAVASSRFALSAAYRLDSHAPSAMHEECRKLLDSACASLTTLEASEGRDAEAAARLRQDCATLLETMQAMMPMLHGVYEGVERAMAITTQVLEYAEAGRLIAGDHKTRVSAMLDELLKGVSVDLRARGVTLTVDIDPGLELPMREDHAFAILRNLLANARDAVCDKPRSEVGQQIVLSAHGQARKVVVSVADTGSGMSDTDQASIFQPFFSTKGAKGTGLGLGLSRKLARLYGGDLEFSSKQGQGTTFTLSVPQSETGDVARKP